MAGLGVVAATNGLLSGLANPASVPGKLMAAWRFGTPEVVLADFILTELRRSLPRLVHRHGLTTDFPEPLPPEPLQHESRFKRRQSVLQGLPGVVDRRQQPPLPKGLTATSLPRQR
jgi:hypothetical protein